MYILPNVILEISKNLEMYLIYSNELIASYFSWTLQFNSSPWKRQKTSTFRGIKKVTLASNGLTPFWYRTNHPDIFCEKGFRKNFAIFTGKHQRWSLFFIKLQAFRRFCKVFKNTYFEKHLHALVWYLFWSICIISPYCRVYFILSEP